MICGSSVDLKNGIFAHKLNNQANKQADLVSMWQGI
jgi:hypothetical protein